MNIKIIKVLIPVFVFFNLLSAHKGYAGWPISRMPAIEGIVTDSTTGEPIENVEINFRWIRDKHPYKNSIVNLYDTTNKEGRYKIQKKTIWHFISVFQEAKLRANHPLYENKIISWWPTDLQHLKKGENEYRVFNEIRYINGEYKDGVIYCNLSLERAELNKKGKQYEEKEYSGPKLSYRNLMCNLRYNTLLGINYNQTLQYEYGNDPLQIQAGIGSGGGKIGFGYGDAGSGASIPSGPGIFGIGIKFNFIKSWDDVIFNTKEKYLGEEWIGVEFTAAFLIGVDFGYYRSIKTHDKKMFNFGIGLFY